MKTSTKFILIGIMLFFLFDSVVQILEKLIDILLLALNLNLWALIANSFIINTVGIIIFVIFLIRKNEDYYNINRIGYLVIATFLSFFVKLGSFYIYNERFYNNISSTGQLANIFSIEKALNIIFQLVLLSLIAYHILKVRKENQL